jgi:hypothetical protein
MIAALLFSLVSASVPCPPAATPWVLQGSADAEVEAKINEAGSDVARLLELAASLTAAGKDDGAKQVYRKIITIDPNHEAARKALRHHNYDGKWFESYAELSKYRREETANMKAKGLARFKDQWVPEADLPYLNMGWTRDEAGKWINPVEAEKKRKEQELLAKGYEFRSDDCTWIAPEDKAKWTPDSWKCGDKWLTMKEANEYHSQPQQMWRLESQYFTVMTTCDWEGGNWARFHADHVYPELVRLFGLQPSGKPHFIVLNSLAQYNDAAGGNPSWLPDLEGISSLYGAYFADGFFDQSTTPPQYQGCGVSYWDRKDAKLTNWGPYWLRFAAAQSFCEAIDPSLLTISEAVAAGVGQGSSFENFWKEKKIPRWLRYGAASYVDRFARNYEAGQGGNPWDIREFAFAQLKEAGGLRKIEDVFAFALDPNDPTAPRLYQEAGLLVSFLLDGGESKKLKEKHEAFKAALKSASKSEDKDLQKAIEELQKELEKSEKEIKKFAGL